MFNTNRLVCQVATRAVLFLAAAGLILTATACPPPEKTVEDTTTVKPPPPPPPKVKDQAFDDLDAVSLQGSLFSPTAITGIPTMPSVAGKRKNLNLVKQRRFFARAKANVKEFEGQVLVTMLWEESRNQLRAGAKDKVAELRAEIGTVLQAVKAQLGDQTSLNTLLMMFTHGWVTDAAAALVVGNEITARFADSTKQLAPWVAYLQLRSWQTDAAAQLVTGWDVNAAETSALHAYVLAWVAFRQGDYPTARIGITKAARAWPIKRSQGRVEGDLLLMMARSGTPLDEVLPILAELSNGDARTQASWLVAMYNGYMLTGHETRAAKALAKAVELVGAEGEAQQLVQWKRGRTEALLVASSQPQETADAAIDAYKSLVACGEPCAAMEKEIGDRLVTVVTFFHTVYGKAFDDRYYGPAKQVYDYYLTLNRPDKEQLRRNLDVLEKTKEAAARLSGEYDRYLMDTITGWRSKAILSCYEATLQLQPDLAGSIKLTLMVSDAGQVTGVETEPAAGAEGLARVAQCIQERARTWPFPRRTTQGVTSIIRTYNFAPVPPK